MKKEIDIKVYESEKSEKYTVVNINTLLDLVKKHQVMYEVYKKRWYLITIAIMLLLIGDF